MIVIEVPACKRGLVLPTRQKLFFTSGFTLPRTVLLFPNFACCSWLVRDESTLVCVCVCQEKKSSNFALWLPCALRRQSWWWIAYSRFASIRKLTSGKASSPRARRPESGSGEVCSKRRSLCPPRPLLSNGEPCCQSYRTCLGSFFRSFFHSHSHTLPPHFLLHTFSLHLFPPLSLTDWGEGLQFFMCFSLICLSHFSQGDSRFQSLSFFPCHLPLSLSLLWARLNPGDKLTGASADPTSPPHNINSSLLFLKPRQLSFYKKIWQDTCSERPSWAGLWMPAVPSACLKKLWLLWL